ncbi:hypothetical protein WN943_029463 [Citrus x changshan-huyou]
MFKKNYDHLRCLRRTMTIFLKMFTLKTIGKQPAIICSCSIKTVLGIWLELQCCWKMVGC